jgi:predicted nuclease of predicted toxin-antitoxin system
MAGCVVRLFIDEDLSPRLAGECHTAGYDATSVRDRSMLNASDREVSALCLSEDRVLVTNNAQDFFRLAKETGVHPGLVVLPLGSREEMCSLMRVAIEEIKHRSQAAGLAPADFMVNRVVEIAEDGSCEHFGHP